MLGSKADDVKLRYSMALDRVKEIGNEEPGLSDGAGYFKELAGFYLDPSYDITLPGKYEESFLDPQYAAKKLGKGTGQLLSFIFYESLSVIPFRAEGRTFDELILMELFIRIHDLFLNARDGQAPAPDIIREEIKQWVLKHLDHTAAIRIREQIDPSLDFAYRIIMEEDLSDPSYLYKFGEYIDKDVKETAEYIASFPEEKVKLMADAFTEGFRKGFIAMGKDITKKSAVNIRFNLGFERVVREAVKNFEKMGLKTTFMRRALHTVNKGSLIRVGYTGAISNRQMEFDHRDDRAIFFDSEFVEKKIQIIEETYRNYSSLAATFAGPAIMEIFGEFPFLPEMKSEVITLNPAQQKLFLEHSARLGKLSNRYIPVDERSYTMISFPVPAIGPDYREIFDETVKINTLDYEVFKDMQQLLILALEKGKRVRIRGKGANKTDITVSLHALNDPEKETVFENCVADVNIPVGEVFTSPSLPGTNGVLFVSEVYLFGLRYENLEFRIRDGFVVDYTCTNFSDEKKNREYIKENILHNHDTLPLGEFAIGTNTYAYSMAKRFDIFSELPILIAEKTGPHFAFGDTCYSREEDKKVYNPDGREIISRDNEETIKRKDNADFRYYECHTDVTIPYDELLSITSIDDDGNEYPLIKDGVFVVPGCEALNIPLSPAPH